MKPHIPESEFAERAKSAQSAMREQGIDLLFAYGNEGEPQYQKYFSGYHPSFETAGVIMAQDGPPVLLVGPESEGFATERGRIKNVRRMTAFRESISPRYEGGGMAAFDTVIDELMGGGRPKRLAIAGYSLLPQFLYSELLEGLCKYGDIEVLDGDHIVDTLRSRKSVNELACIAEACDITRAAMDYLMQTIVPGETTEAQVRGLALAKMFELGAEGEAFPMWILSGEGSNQPISRPRHKVIPKDDFVHIQIGAKYEGYSSALGRPVFTGPPKREYVDAMHAGFACYDALITNMYDGNTVENVMKAYHAALDDKYKDWFMYGPCHGTGLMECEYPWIEDGAGFTLTGDMAFCIDLFMHKGSRGFRLEDTVRIGKDGAVNLTHYTQELLSI